jgi:hypothetical protein
MTVDHLQRNSAAEIQLHAWFVTTQLETAAFAKSTAKKKDQ